MFDEAAEREKLRAEKASRVKKALLDLGSGKPSAEAIAAVQLDAKDEDALKQLREETEARRWGAF